MDWLWHFFWHDGSLFGVRWTAWEIVGWAGNLLFTSRFFVQWWATEKHQRVVVPPIFWWLSMAGSGCLLAYGFSQKNSVFVFAYLFTWIPYIRNLIIGSRMDRRRQTCAGCGTPSPGEARFCAHCGVRLATPTA
jgi:lipid-A-disaccharide synthase-like uncharacterized protein